MALMDELPVEMPWRDARIEWAWDGTGEIRGHIIGCALPRPHEA
jgi:alkylation response protein AidB-like acyl-CoA dehydrogenase